MDEDQATKVTRRKSHRSRNALDVCEDPVTNIKPKALHQPFLDSIRELIVVLE